MKKICLFIILAALTANVSAGKYPDPKRFEKDIVKYEEADKKQMPPEGAIVAIGSSSMRGWHGTIKKDLAPLTIIPRGFGGSNMNDALAFVDRIVINYKPRAVVLYEGDNDMQARVKPEEFIEKFKGFAAKINKALPKTRIYVISVKPSISRWKIWPSMQKCNELLKAECEKNELLTFIDVATPMLGEDGTPKKEIFKKDNLHMVRDGYVIWTNTVKPVLDKKELALEKK